MISALFLQEVLYEKDCIGTACGVLSSDRLQIRRAGSIHKILDLLVSVNYKYHYSSISDLSTS